MKHSNDATLTFTQFLPTRELSPYIYRYYLTEGDFGERTEDVFYADACPEIVFNVNVDFYRNDRKEDWAKVIGQIVDPLHVRAKGRGKSFGVWFHPHGLSAFSHIPVHEITNTAVSFEDVFDKHIQEQVGHCLLENRIPTLVTILNQYFLKLLTHRPMTFQRQLAKHIAERSFSLVRPLAMEELASQYNTSVRYLQKIFKTHVGVGPKKYFRIQRFQLALNMIYTTTEKSLTEIALESGYYDQSHLIREFKRFTDVPPSAFTAKKHPINHLFLSS